MIGLLITGNEVLWGKIRDTNSSFLAAELRKHGLLVRRTLLCGDSLNELSQCLAFLFDACDTVIMTGGLGPTLDDLTFEAAAGFFGRELVFNREAWDLCQNHFAKIGKVEIPESNRRQAMLPEGATILANPHGTASGILVQGVWKNRHVRLFALPGVPREMQPMFTNHVLPQLTPSAKMHVSAWQVFLVGESAIQDRLKALEERLLRDYSNLIISYQAHHGYVTWRLSAAISGEKSVSEWEGVLSSVVRPHLAATFGRHVMYESEERLPEYLVRVLNEKHLRIGFAESCTGGLLAREITRVPNASRTFLGGVVVYSNDSKTDLLGVEPRTIERFGAVSIEVAAQLATGACHVFSSEIALGVTGVAGPGGGTPAHPVGDVCFGLCLPRARIMDEERLVEVLSSYGWLPTEEIDHLDYDSSHRNIDFVAERRFGSSLSREDVQQRAMNFALGSLAGILSEIS